MVRRCRPDDIGMSVSYPLPGTKFYENVRLQLGEKQNWLDSGDFEMMYIGSYTTDFYRQLHATLHKEFRARRALGRLLGTTDPRRWTMEERRRAHGLKGKLRDLKTLTVNLATLPAARLKLNNLARNRPHRPLSMPQIMTPEAAATPTAQGE